MALTVGLLRGRQRRALTTCSLSSPPSRSHLPQAVIQNPFSNGGSPAGEAVGGETRFAYFPATAVSDGTVSVQAASDPQLTQAGGESLRPLHCGVLRQQNN